MQISGSMGLKQNFLNDFRFDTSSRDFIVSIFNEKNNKSFAVFNNNNGAQDNLSNTLIKRFHLDSSIFIDEYTTPDNFKRSRNGVQDYYDSNNNIIYTICRVHSSETIYPSQNIPGIYDGYVCIVKIELNEINLSNSITSIVGYFPNDDLSPRYGNLFAANYRIHYVNNKYAYVSIGHPNYNFFKFYKIDLNNLSNSQITNLGYKTNAVVTYFNEEEGCSYLSTYQSEISSNAFRNIKFNWDTQTAITSINQSSEARNYHFKGNIFRNISISSNVLTLRILNFDNEVLEEYSTNLGSNFVRLGIPYFLNDELSTFYIRHGYTNGTLYMNSLITTFQQDKSSALLSGSNRLNSIYSSELSSSDRGQGLFIVDEAREQIIQVQFEINNRNNTDKITFYRYDLDFNNKESWSPDNTYGVDKIGNTYSEIKPYYDYETGDMYSFFCVADSETGKTTTNGASMVFSRIVFDTTLTNSTFTHLCDYAGNPDQFVVSTRSVKVLYVDKENSLVYYNSGTGNVANNSNFYISNYNSNTLEQDTTINNELTSVSAFKFTNATKELQFLTRTGSGLNGYRTFNFDTEILSPLTINRFLTDSFNDNIEAEFYDDYIETSLVRRESNDDLKVVKETYDYNLNLKSRFESEVNINQLGYLSRDISVGKNTNIIYVLGNYTRYFNKYLPSQVTTTVEDTLVPNLTRGNTNRYAGVDRFSFPLKQLDEDTLLAFFIDDSAFAEQDDNSVSFLRYDLSTTTPSTIDRFDLPNTYTSRNQVPWLHPSGDFALMIMDVDDSASGKTTTAGYSMRLVRIDFDYDDLTNCTVTQLCDIIDPDDHLITGGNYSYNIFWHQDNTLYLARGQGGLLNTELFVINTSTGSTTSLYNYNETGYVVKPGGNYFDPETLVANFICIINSNTNEIVYRQFDFSTMKPINNSYNRFSDEFIGFGGYFVQNENEVWVAYTNSLNLSGSDLTLYVKKYDKDLNVLYHESSYVGLSQGNSLRGNVLFTGNEINHHFFYQFQGNSGTKQELWQFTIDKKQRKFPFFEKPTEKKAIEVLTITPDNALYNSDNKITRIIDPISNNFAIAPANIEDSLFYNASPGGNITKPVIQRNPDNGVVSSSVTININFLDLLYTSGSKFWVLNLTRQLNANAVDLLRGDKDDNNNILSRLGAYQNTYVTTIGNQSLIYSTNIASNPPGDNSQFRFYAERIEPGQLGSLHVCKEDGTTFTYSSSAVYTSPTNTSSVQFFNFGQPSANGHNFYSAGYAIIDVTSVGTLAEEYEIVNKKMNQFAQGSGLTWTDLTI